ncbi:Uncharacterized protein HZ326_1947 [Fusarium oxysporum f. sp. albedinis]|nr:Uncharacterized protein HZ326_1947 [Fusarium oxysporum f. sp. albedinis]
MSCEKHPANNLGVQIIHNSNNITNVILRNSGVSVSGPDAADRPVRSTSLRRHPRSLSCKRRLCDFGADVAKWPMTLMKLSESGVSGDISACFRV